MKITIEYLKTRVRSLESLHEILWELFDVENPVYSCAEFKNTIDSYRELPRKVNYSFLKKKPGIETAEEIFYWGLHDNVCCHAGSECGPLINFGGVFELAPYKLADFLYRKYTSGKESMWLTKPDEVLEDIMKVYEQLNA